MNMLRLLTTCLIVVGCAMIPNLDGGRVPSPEEGWKSGRRPDLEQARPKGQEGQAPRFRVASISDLTRRAQKFVGGIPRGGPARRKFGEVKADLVHSHLGYRDDEDVLVFEMEGFGGAFAHLLKRIGDNKKYESVTVVVHASDGRVLRATAK